MLEKVKTALRISHDVLNDDILSSIEAARLEMKRAGVREEMAESEDDDLIVLAIKTFCLSLYSPDGKDRERYDASFRYQLDNLRKSSEYGEAVVE